MPTLQDKGSGALLAALGVTGHSGISFAADTDDATQLDITVAEGAWAVLADGTVLASELVSTTVTGCTTEGTPSLWLDYREFRAQYEPVWTVAVAAPSDRALAIGTVVVEADQAWVVAREDTFDRPNQIGWGTASDGHVWQSVGGIGSETVLDGVGIQTSIASEAHPNGANDLVLLGPTLATGNVEVLVRWQVRENNGDINEGILIALAAPDDASSGTPGPEVDVALHGVSSSGFPDNLGYQDGTDGTWPGASVGDVLWTRARLVDCLLSWRTWVEGETEPTTWQGITKNGAGGGSGCGALSAGRVGVELRDGGVYPPANVLAISSFSARILSPGVASTTRHATGLADLPAQGVPVLRDAHSPTNGYAPRDVVTDAGGLYTCTAPVAAVDTRVDTFVRPDQEGWGTASDGHAWQAFDSPTPSDLSVSGNTGLMTAVDGTTSYCFLGDPLGNPDIDVRVRFNIHASGQGVAGLMVRFLANEDLDTGAFIYFSVYDQRTQVRLVKPDVSREDAYGTWTTYAFNQDFWGRVRVQGQRYQVRVWPDGNDEPSTWDLDHTTTMELDTRSVGLWSDVQGANSVAYDHFSATTIVPAPADDPDHWTALAPAPAQAGTPVLYGPFTVDFTDFGPTPMEGHKKDLWTPQVGDVLLRLFADWQTATAWDHGSLFIGQNIDGTVTPALGVIAATGSFGLPLSNISSLDSLGTALAQGAGTNSAGATDYSSAYVFHSTDPIQIQLAQTSGTDPGAGHVEIYALVARPVAP